jgi:DNA polymerase III subunit delta
MSADKIIADWKKGNFKPIYWLEGEESYYIDQAMDYAEHHLLPANEAEFNRTVFYGRDTEWTTVLNACKRYPMFAERQVVLLKEAQHMKDIEKLESYFEHPLNSTILVVGYKEKKLDARTKFSKLVGKAGEVLTTKKMYDNQLPDWTNQMISQKGFSIAQKALALLVDHIGNDLSRLNNEVDKMIINLGNRKNITEDDIEQYVGISKEFNVFELQDAIGKKDMGKAFRIIQYFESNPKAAPIQLVLPSLYGYFSKVYGICAMQGADDKTTAAAVGVNPYFFKDYKAVANNYGFAGAERALLLLHDYNLKGIGIGLMNVEDASLMKELVVKMMM